MKTVYWITTTVLVIAFIGSGVANLFHAAHVAQDMHQLGYPDYLMTLLGLWKILGAIVIAAPGLPHLKEWAYAGMIFDLSGAAFSRAAMDHGATMVVVPLLLAIVVFVNRALRPVGRRA